MSYPRPSSIPVPPSAMKKSMRMSMGGPPMRAPIASGSRQSVINPAVLQSASKQPFGRTPMKSSTRRGSTWMGAPMPGSQGAPPVKDPRPLRDKAQQAKMRQEILAWLHPHGYDISREALSSITGKDFRSIFEFLVLQLDPSYPFDSSRRLEEQFMQALKCMQYPFVGALDPKWLAAPASMHSWPSLLGVLHWLVDMCKGKWYYASSSDPTLQDPNEVPEHFYAEDHHTALAFQYLDTTYQLYLEGMDSFPEQDEILESYYLRKNARVLEEINQSKLRMKEVKDEYERLRESAPPLEKLLVELESTKRDEMKLQKMLDHRESRKAEIQAIINDEENRIKDAIKRLEILRQEETHYQSVLESQNLSPEEVMRMNADNENLERALEDLRKKVAESYKMIGTHEPTVTNRISDAEESLDIYNNLLGSLGFFPPLEPPLPDIDLRLILNTAASAPSDILRPDVRTVIKPNLNLIAELKMREHAAVATEKIRLEDALDVVVRECDDIEAEIVKNEKDVDNLNEEAESIRYVIQDEQAMSDETISKLEEDLAKAKNEAQASGMGVTTRLKGLRIQYSEQIERVKRLKEETIRTILKSCNDIGAFKCEVESRLNAVKVHAENN